MTRADQLLCEADRTSAGDFVYIPEGPFWEGSDQVERDYAYTISAKGVTTDPTRYPKIEQQLRQRQWFDFEQQRQEINLPSYCIARHLVTNADYQLFIQATGHRAPGISEADYQQQGFLVHPYADVRPFLWVQDQFPPGEGEHPVVLVSLVDAEAYADCRSHQEGQVYRLKTALEWEKAARGPEGRYFPWGDEWEDEATNWSGSGLWHTSAIGTYPLSHSLYGVHDMAGNVFEFTSTLRIHNQQQRSVMKGCSWDDLPGFCRAAYQHTRPVDSRHILFGFRLVKEIP